MDDATYVIFGYRHVCGEKLYQCKHCLDIFCPECDVFCSKTKICCKRAVMDAAKDLDNKYEIKKPARKQKSSRKKVEIKEISVHNNELH